MEIRQFLLEASCRPRWRNLYRRDGSIPLLGGAARGIARHTLPPGTRKWLRVRRGLAEGLWLKIDLRYEEQYVEGSYEPLVQRALSEHLAPGSTFYDVGGHIGFFALLAARLVGDTGAVFSFEADPENGRRIEEHASNSGFAHLHVFPAAVWSRSCTLAFERASQFSSRNTGHVVCESNGRETVSVDAVALDDFAATHRPPDFIKIDVEGGEAAVLEGAARVLAECNPIILCEVHLEEARITVERH